MHGVLHLKASGLGCHATQHAPERICSSTDVLFTTTCIYEYVFLRSTHDWSGHQWIFMSCEIQAFVLNKVVTTPVCGSRDIVSKYIYIYIHMHSMLHFALCLLLVSPVMFRLWYNSLLFACERFVKLRKMKATLIISKLCIGHSIVLFSVYTTMYAIYSTHATYAHFLSISNFRYCSCCTPFNVFQHYPTDILSFRQHCEKHICKHVEILCFISTLHVWFLFLFSALCLSLVLVLCFNVRRPQVHPFVPPFVACLSFIPSF